MIVRQTNDRAIQAITVTGLIPQVGDVQCVRTINDSPLEFSPSCRCLQLIYTLYQSMIFGDKKKYCLCLRMDEE